MARLRWVGLASVGGWLILGAGVFVGIAIWMYLDGEGLGFGAANLSGFLLDGALALFGVGALVLCSVGQEPLDDRLVRAGLGLLAVGQLGLLTFSILATASSPEVLPGVALLLLGGSSPLAAGLGLLVSGIGLVQLPGRARVVGAILLAGAVLLGTVAALALRNAVPSHTMLWALVLAIVGNVGIGVLAIRRPPVPELEDASEAPR